MLIPKRVKHRKQFQDGSNATKPNSQLLTVNSV